MERRVAVSSMGTRLCLLYLLEGWLASRLAFAAPENNVYTGYNLANGNTFTYHTNGNNNTQHRGLWGPLSEVRMSVNENNTANMICEGNRYIHIKKAVWSSICSVVLTNSSPDTACARRYDRTAKIGKICDHRQSCDIIPSRRDYVDEEGNPDEGGVWHVALGDPSTNRPLRLVVIVECWDPCFEVDCVGGKCVATAYNSFTCECDVGYSNANAVVGSEHCEPYDMCKASPSPCPKGEICSDGIGKLPKCSSCPEFHIEEEGECVAIDMCKASPSPCPEGAICSDGDGKLPKCTPSCPEFYIEEEEECVAIDMCKASPSPCPKGAICSDGNGKLPKCSSCPEFYIEEEEECVAIDTCETLECPQEAVCTDGVGKQGTCQCGKYHELRNGECEPVDQCLINNGGCDPKATCTDGVGKPATCLCPKDEELNEEKKCVFVNSCSTENGGCHQNAICEHKEGEEVKCTCKRGFIGDGHVCNERKSLLFPDNGTIKLELVGVEGIVFFHLGKCLSIIAEPKVNYYIVMPPDRAPHFIRDSGLRETTEEGKLTIMLHRNNTFMEVYFLATLKGSIEKNVHPKVFWMHWDVSCDIDEITVQDDRGAQTDAKFFLTQNFVADEDS